MATRSLSNRIRSKRPTRAATPTPPSPPESPPPDPLVDVPEPPGIEVTDAFFCALQKVAKELEDARTELMQLHGMIRCLHDVLLYADDDDSPMHADVAHVIARLLNDVITTLELTKNQLPTNAELARSIMGDTDKDVAV